MLRSSDDDALDEQHRFFFIFEAFFFSQEAVQCMLPFLMPKLSTSYTVFFFY